MDQLISQDNTITYHKKEMYNHINFYNRFVSFINNKLVFARLDGIILYCDLNTMKICKIINPIVDEQGKKKQIYVFINAKYIIISHKNDFRIANLPYITNAMDNTDITLQWRTIVIPYDNALTDENRQSKEPETEQEDNLYYSIGTYYDNIYLCNGLNLYLYDPELDCWKIFNPSVLSSVSDNVFLNNSNIFNIIFTNFKDKKNYILRLTDQKNINSDIIYRDIKNQHNKITKYFTHNSAYNFVAKVDDFTIKTNTLDNYILDNDDETTWIEHRIPFMEDNEFIISCGNEYGYFIIATYKKIYYCVIGKWEWLEIEVLEAPEPYESSLQLSLRKYNSSGTENTDEDKDKYNESKYVEIDKGIRNLWCGLHNYQKGVNNICATTIDGRIFRILKDPDSDKLICAEIYCYGIKIINFIDLMCLSVKSIFLDKYLIVIDNIQEQIKKLNEKYSETDGNINLTDKPDTQDNTQSNTTTVDEKDMHTTEPETTETLDIYTTIDNIDKPITTDNDNHTTTRVQEQPEFEPAHIL